MSLLEIQNLNVSFGHEDDLTHAVSGVSLTLEKGEMLALVGESGSGKTLTALSILNLLPTEAMVEGKVTFNGKDAHKQLAKLRGDRVGMIFQEPMTSLNPLHKVRRQIAEAYRVHHKGKVPKKVIDNLFEQVGLSYLADRPHTYPHELSGGERQRVMIAMAIANNPDLLIADEPTTALDVTLQTQILRQLKTLQKEKNMAVLLITHDLTVVKKIADKVAVMQAGEIVEMGTVSQVFRKPQHAYTKMLLAAQPKGAPAPIPTNAHEVIACENLKVHFPVKSSFLRRTVSVVKAVEDISLRVREGETLGIVGESGSGKSSLGFALLRLINSDGPIVFMGNRIDTMQKEKLRGLRSGLQLVFQDPYGSLNPRMTVSELISEGLRVHQKLDAAEVDARVSEILKQVGLSEAMKDRYPHEFSGGQRQRIAIARAMILKPYLVVLDEPTSALDMSVQAQVLDLLRELQQKHQVAYVFISHDLRTVKALAHYVLVLKKGEVVEEGDTKTIFSKPQQDYTKALIHAAFGESL